MPKKIKIPKITWTRIKRTSKWIEPKLGWFLPTAEEVHYMLKNPVALCPYCNYVYNPYVYPYDVCGECGTLLEIYRGPLYGKLTIAKQNFTSEMVVNRVLTFATQHEESASIKINVVMNNSWPALMKYYSNGVYEGFYHAAHRNYRQDIAGVPMGTLLTPMQAAFYERYALIRQGKEEEQAGFKKNRDKDYTIAKTFMQLYTLNAFDVDDSIMEEFTKVLNASENSFRTKQDEWILNSLS